ncbi:DNA-binding transcriptional regulator HcaR [Photorhabdus antumapuensis]|uniref:DNA-binding transcriptional regulator HcaR n=1 Tax=Photorhabdus antumapuensis TaxID=2862867 RepID=UPI001CEC51B7|nr:DNA-binding transcriptional regulator HcaR [Photorhabdus antumapuensis]MCA6220989.1 DNA-binding transcriptional regulator HcaR [Photorhabdus antumapuensis]
MELRHLRYFIAVAEELNFTKAAKKLHTAQPSLSQQIKDLEDYIGSTLLERNKRRVSLTKAGEVFFQQARLILDNAEKAKKMARKAAQEQIVLTIGFVPSAEVKVLPEVIPVFRLVHPVAKVELISLFNPGQEEKLLQGDIDVAFMRPPIKSDYIDFKVILNEPLVVLMPANHRLRYCEKISVNDLHGENFITPDPTQSGVLQQIIENYFTEHNVVPNIIQTANNMLLILNMVSLNLGCAIVPFYITSIMTDAVICRPLSGYSPTIELIMAWRKDNTSELLSHLIDVVENKYLQE